MHGVKREHDAVKLALKARNDETKIIEYRKALQICQILRNSLKETQLNDNNNNAMLKQWMEALNSTNTVLAINR